MIAWVISGSLIVVIAKGGGGVGVMVVVVAAAVALGVRLRVWDVGCMGGGSGECDSNVGVPLGLL